MITWLKGSILRIGFTEILEPILIIKVSLAGKGILPATRQADLLSLFFRVWQWCLV